MNKTEHYTEDDFQNYLDHHFTGDRNEMESHLQDCELCHEKYQAYHAVWTFARYDLGTDQLGIDLAKVVANKVFVNKERKNIFELLMYGLFICIVMACLYVSFEYLSSLSIPFSSILCLIPLFLYFILSYKEIQIVHRKFALS